MAGERSILDGLTAGSIVVAEGAETPSASGQVAGAELDPGAAFGPDPEPRAGDEPDAGAGTGGFGTLEIDADGPALAPSAGAGAGTSARGAASPNYDREAAARKRAETNARKATGSAKENIGLLEGLLIGVHSFLAMGLKNPGWQLSEDEAATLAEAATKVQAQYNLVLDPKSAAWMGLIAACGSVYGPRVFAQVMMNNIAKAQRAMMESEIAANAANSAPPANAGPVRNPGEQAVQQPTRKEAEKIMNGRRVDVSQFAIVPSHMYPPGSRGG